MNKVRQLEQFGQSVWLDNIRRSLLTTGELRRMVEQDGLGGLDRVGVLRARERGHERRQERRRR